MDSVKLLLLLAGHLVLTGLPIAAAMLYAARRGVRQVPVLLAIGLAASGAVGILGFWSYYGDQLMGESFSYFVLLGSILLAGWSLYGGHLDRALLGRLGTPLVLWVLGSAFLLFLGFVHGGTGSHWRRQPRASRTRCPATAKSRSSLPNGSSKTDTTACRRSFPGNGCSATGPLFRWATCYLSARSAGMQTGSATRSSGSCLQQLWIVGLWALLVAAKVRRVTRALAMLAVLVSGLAIVNGFFVWPKLLPAAMLLAAAALVLTPLWPRLRRNLWAAGLVAALCALAMLGHGSSVFGIIAIAAIAAYRGLPSWRWVGVGLVVGIALMAPGRRTRSTATLPATASPSGPSRMSSQLTAAAHLKRSSTPTAKPESAAPSTTRQRTSRRCSGGAPALDALDNAIAGQPHGSRPCVPGGQLLLPTAFDGLAASGAFRDGGGTAPRAAQLR